MDLADPTNQHWMQSTIDFRKLTKNCIGAQVMFTRNVDLQKGATNGAIGIVENVIFKNQEISQIIMSVASTQKQVAISKSTYKMDYYKGQHRSKNTFPLNLGYAISGHKSQGASIRTKVDLVIR